MIAQKHMENKQILEKFVILFGGYVENHSVKDVYQYTINGVRNMKEIIQYFEKYQLKSKKKNSFHIWKEIFFKIKNNEHKSEESRNKIKEMSIIINKLSKTRKRGYGST